MSRRLLERAAPRGLWVPARCLAVLALAGAASAFAATTGTTALLKLSGSGSAANFGDYVSNDGQLDTYHAVFFEVPEGLGRLDIDLFDADVGNGDPAVGPRDRERGGYDTSVTYRLFDPSDNLVTTLSCDDSTCADNTWTSLISLTSGGSGDDYRDDFESVSYSNSDGSLDWSTSPWVESNDNGAPGSGEILITGGQLNISDNFGAPSTITRQVDLSSFANATLSFTFNTTAAVDPSDEINIEVSGNGGGSWTTLETFSGEFLATEARSYDISGFIASDTQIRFIVETFYAGGGEFFQVDFVRIEDSAATIEAGHWELQIDQSSAVTGGDDINGLGIRVHDGDPTSGGTEINAYFYSFAGYGSNDGSLTRTYQHYPYMTSGCEFDLNEFDWDSVGSITLTSPTTSFAQSPTVSGDGTWANTTLTGFTSLFLADEYGIWDLDASITGPASGTGNYATLYLGEFDAADPGPTTQPEADTFRIYLPTDGASGDAAGTAPAKTSLSQSLVHISGPNPPVQGMTSIVAVVIEVTHPADAVGPVTFSASNRVVSNIPGGEVLFVDSSEQTDSGTIVLAPLGGGSGDVVWEPDTLGPGDTARLSYHVEVTPAAAPSVVAVTGVPGSGDGTRVSLIDETGVESYDFGEICQLSVDTQQATAVAVASFALYRDRAGTWVEWRTGAETGTVGFDLWRFDPARSDYVRVNDKRITGLLSEPQGGTYRALDTTAGGAEDATYMLVEHEATGGVKLYGPYTRRVESERWHEAESAAPLWPAAEKRPAAGAGSRQVPRAKGTKYARSSADFRSATLGRSAGRSPQRQPVDLERLVIGPPRPPVPGGPLRPAMTIGVTQTGLYRIEAADISAKLGLTINHVLSLLARHRLKLTHRGLPVAWARSGDGEALEFFGEALDSAFAPENVYRLALGRGLRMGSIDGGSPAAAPAAVFRDTVHAEENNRTGILFPIDPELDIFFWDIVVNGDASLETAILEFELPGVSSLGGSMAELRIELQGVSVGEHQLSVELNGVSIGSAELSDFARVTHSTGLLPQSLLLDGLNTLQVHSAAGGIVLIESIETSYDRLYEAAADGALIHRGDGNGVISVAGFGSPDIRVFGLEDSRRPELYTGVAIESAGAGYRVSYAPDSLAVDHLAVEAQGVLTPAWTETDNSSRLTADNQADYLIITTSEMVAAAETLAAHRAAQGHQTMVIDVVDIYDEVNSGIRDPRALREFLRQAYQFWTVPPRYVLIAANGTFDYLDHRGFGDNLIPTLLTSTTEDFPAVVASDALFADFEGDDGVPELAIGRVPALTAAELQAYVDKIIAAEGVDPGDEVADAVYLVADNDDGGGTFGADSDRLSVLLSAGFESVPIHLDALDLQTARGLLAAGLEGGVPLINYLGHGSTYGFAGENLFTLDDLTALQPQGDRLSVLAAVTCYAGYFAIPGYDALSEALVIRPEGGAAAVWSPVFLSSNEQAKVLADRFFRRVFQAGERVLGDAVVGALADSAGLISSETLKRYVIVGDPATRLQLEAGGLQVGPGTPGE